MTPHIVCTCGDPGGIGPEVLFKALISVRELEMFKVTIWGGRKIFEDIYYAPLISQLKETFKTDVLFENATEDESLIITKGQASADNGHIAYSAISRAVQSMKSNAYSGLITAPICKESMRLAGSRFMGHTDMLKHFTQSQHVTMGFITPSFSVVLATVHIPIKDVPKILSPKLVEHTIEHAKLLGNYLGISQPKVAVAGINPHAGEYGLIGNEEVDWVQSLVDKLKSSFPGLKGVYPPDTVFLSAKKGESDIVVCMYHDQGLIPVKLLHFDSAVNITLGLPFIRTSPDHGTAYDIAFMEKADPSSTIHAIHTVLKSAI